jgi:hypothetical protein
MRVERTLRGREDPRVEPVTTMMAACYAPRGHNLQYRLKLVADATLSIAGYNTSF